MWISQEIQEDAAIGADALRQVMAESLPMQSLPPLCLCVDERQMVAAFKRAERQLESVRLAMMVNRMSRCGAISERQRKALEGVNADTDPNWILRVLSRHQ